MLQAGTAFVGRSRELAEITSLLDDAAAGRGRLFLLSGDPGIGKTALAERIAADARARGFAVAWANARGAEGAPALWPWIELLESDDLLGTPAHNELLAELRAEDAAAPVVQPADATDARFRLFERIVDVLRQAAQRRPVLAVLEDLHWADQPSLSLLTFIEPRLRERALVIVGTWRDDALLDPLLGVSGDVMRLPLGGLAQRETAELVEATIGHRLRPAVAHAIHERTAGNPLFTKELTRLLAAQNRLEAPGLSAVPHALPATIRSVLERRLAGLTTECRTALTEAAVIGQRFTVAALAHIHEGRHDLRLLLEEADAAQIVEPHAGGSWTFVHALVREVLYADLAPNERRRLHAAAAASLSDDAGEDVTAEIAHHLRLSGHDVAAAVASTHRAAELAMRRLAYEDAVRQYEEALELTAFEPRHESHRCELLLGLGHALLRLGDTEAARDAFLRAAESARTLADPELLARAALGYGTLHQFAGFSGADQTCRDLVEDALSALPTDPSPLRVELLHRLAYEVYYTDQDRLLRLTAEVESLLPRLDDPASHARAEFVRRTVLLGTPNVAERRVQCHSIVRLADECGDLELSITGRAHRVVDAIELGDIAAVEHEAAEVTRRADELRLPSWLWFPALWRATFAILEGRLQDGEALTNRALEIGGPRGQEALDHYGIQLMALRREQGRLAELEPLVRVAIDQYPYVPSYRCVLALLEAEAGRTAAARAELHRLAADGFASIPTDFNFTISAALLAETCGVLGDAVAAAPLYERLEPYADLYVNAGFGALCYGSMARFLALLADAMGRFEEAERLFNEAAERNRRIGAAPAIARTRYEHARMLIRRNEPGDQARVRELLAEARDIATSLGLVELSKRIGQIEPSAPTAVQNTFRKEGDVWTVRFGGQALLLKDSKGVRDLSALMKRQGTEVHVLDLVAAQERTDARTLAGVLGHRGEDVLDETARTAYRERLEELRAEVEQAERFGDTARAERARRELEAISRELASAYGIGGRARRTTSPVERARKAVQARVRDAIRRISEEHPKLGRHLERSVRTGMYCSYSPDEPVSWSL